VIEHPTIDEALDAYESVMLPRALDNAKTAQQMLATLMPDSDSDTDDAAFPCPLAGRRPPRLLRRSHQLKAPAPTNLKAAP
jgi:hypothetical protein